MSAAKMCVTCGKPFIKPRANKITHSESEDADCRRAYKNSAKGEERDAKARKECQLYGHDFGRITVTACRPLPASLTLAAGETNSPNANRSRLNWLRTSENSVDTEFEVAFATGRCRRCSRKTTAEKSTQSLKATAGNLTGALRPGWEVAQDDRPGGDETRGKAEEKLGGATVTDLTERRAVPVWADREAA